MGRTIETKPPTSTSNTSPQHLQPPPGFSPRQSSVPSRLLHQGLVFRLVEAHRHRPLMHTGAPDRRLFNAAIVFPIGGACSGLVVGEEAVEVAHLAGSVVLKIALLAEVETCKDLSEGNWGAL